MKIIIINLPMWEGRTARITGYAYGFTNVIVDDTGTDLALKPTEYRILY